MKVEIPLLLPKEANPNWRGSWQAKAKATKVFREAAFYCAVNARLDGVGPFHKARLKITLVVPSQRYFRDPDNTLASLKPALDGCVDAQLIKDDSDVNLLIQLPILWVVDKEKAPLTILEFEEV